MTVARIVPALTLMACLAAPALAQAPSRSLAARVGALEKENAALRADVDRLEKLLTQTRRDMVTVQGGRVGAAPGVGRESRRAEPCDHRCGGEDGDGRNPSSDGHGVLFPLWFGEPSWPASATFDHARETSVVVTTARLAVPPGTRRQTLHGSPSGQDARGSWRVSRRSCPVGPAGDARTAPQDRRPPLFAR